MLLFACNVHHLYQALHFPSNPPTLLHILSPLVSLRHCLLGPGTKLGLWCLTWGYQLCSALLQGMIPTISPLCTRSILRFKSSSMLSFSPPPIYKLSCVGVHSAHVSNVTSQGWLHPLTQPPPQSHVGTVTHTHTANDIPECCTFLNACLKCDYCD